MQYVYVRPALIQRPVLFLAIVVLFGFLGLLNAMSSRFAPTFAGPAMPSSFVFAQTTPSSMGKRECATKHVPAGTVISVVPNFSMTMKWTYTCGTGVIKSLGNEVYAGPEGRVLGHLDISGEKPTDIYGKFL
jgi:hypothetical protein